MVAPADTMDLVARNIADDDHLPNEMSVIFHEADTENEDADVDLPLLEVQLANSDRVKINNTDLAGFVVDENPPNSDIDEAKTGRIYHAEYELTLELNVWTTAEDGYDANKLGEAVRTALYPYSSYGDQKPFLDEEGEPVDEIFRFIISDGTRADDLIQTPTVRRWRQEVELWACEEFVTSEDYIVSVDYPSDGDFNDYDDDGVIDDT